MTPSSAVTVFNFRLFVLTDDGWIQPPYKAPRDKIVHQLGGVVLEGTAEEVEPSMLDDDGVYRRVATGWGALN